MYNSIGGGRKLVAFYFWEKPACRDYYYFFLNKDSRDQIHTFQSSLHREAGILTLIQRDEPEKPLNRSNTSVKHIHKFKRKKRERERERMKKNNQPITFRNCLDTWFPDAAGYQAGVCLQVSTLQYKYLTAVFKQIGPT